MAMMRRTTSRMSASIWPGFVDAMTALLLVLMFVLTIFMILQYVLQETISGQENELDELASEITSLAQALGLEQQRVANLEDSEAALTTSLEAARGEIVEQTTLIATLTGQIASQEDELADRAARITSFEAQVASLLSQRDEALAVGERLTAEVADLEEAQTRLIGEQEALNLALAQARDEIDAASEAARLAAARREALEALTADLRAENEGLETELSEAETARLADAAAAEALRERLANSDAELTAMTLALEERRREAEDTLTLLAAAQAAEEDLSARLAEALAASDTQSDEITALMENEEELRARLAAALAAQVEAETLAEDGLTEAERNARLLASANEALQAEEAKSAESLRRVALLNEQIAALRTQLGSLQSLLDDAAARDVAAQVQIDALGTRLNTALAQVAAEERRRADLEAERARLLEAEAEDLERYRSEFFGQLRDLLGNREGVQIVGDRFVFSSEVLFDLGSADLAPAGTAQIGEVAGILRDVAREIPAELDWILRVDGHTDNIPILGGTYADNWELSQARALSVVRYMTEQLGFPPDRLAAAGFGEYRPVNPADTPEARAQNRRIELKLTER